MTINTFVDYISFDTFLRQCMLKACVLTLKRLIKYNNRYINENTQNDRHTQTNKHQE